MSSEAIYCGCLRAGEPGHYQRAAGGGQPRGEPWHWLDCKAGMFRPPSGVQGHAWLSHIGPNRTLLSFADYTGDKRPGSHSTFLLPGHLSFDDAKAEAQRLFPWVWERFDFEVVYDG